MKMFEDWIANKNTSIVKYLSQKRGEVAFEEADITVGKFDSIKQKKT